MDAKSSHMFWTSNSIPIYSMDFLIFLYVTPKEVPRFSIDLLEDFFGENESFHDVAREARKG